MCVGDMAVAWCTFCNLFDLHLPAQFLAEQLVRLAEYHLAAETMGVIPHQGELNMNSRQQEAQMQDSTHLLSKYRHFRLSVRTSLLAKTKCGVQVHSTQDTQALCPRSIRQ